jgi:hypothetical protein
MRNKQYITGNVCEISESTYSYKFGSDVRKYEILHFSADNVNASIIGDLTDISTLPEKSIDCFIVTQTLNFIENVNDAIKGIHHILRDGGTALVTVAGICQISRYDMDRWGDYWRFTELSIRNHFNKVFGESNIDVASYGNVLTCISYLHGISAEELTEQELFYRDKDYQAVITIVARKPQSESKSL